MWERRRRIFAIATALLWLVAIEVLPNLHLAVHADDHTHAADGTIHAALAPRDHGHDHGEGRHRHRRPYPQPPSARQEHGDEAPQPAHAHRPRKARRDTPAELAIDQVVVGHAALGVTHHALATIDPPPPCLTPVSEPIATAWTHTIETTAVIARSNARPNARGPPRA